MWLTVRSEIRATHRILNRVPDSRRRMVPHDLDDLEERPVEGAAIALRADFNIPLAPAEEVGAGRSTGVPVSDASRIERTDRKSVV